MDTLKINKAELRWADKEEFIENLTRRINE